MDLYVHHLHTESDIFGTGTCDELANEYNTQVLANLPIEPAIRVGGIVETNSLF